VSDLRVAVVAEGDTDIEVIEAALRAISEQPFIINRLQPEATRPQLGTGWCGVLKWCREFASRGAANLESDPTLPGFDLFVIHIDADVAKKTYGDCAEGGAAVFGPVLGFPCDRPCPPAEQSVESLRARVLSWLGLAGLGPKTVLCVPSQTTETWLAAIILPAESPLRQLIECHAINLEILPLDLRVKKSRAAYRGRGENIASQWQEIIETCAQALRFDTETSAVLAATGEATSSAT
jgi:hypothetical protein